MNIKEALKQAGLPENEAKVYLTLLEIGSETAGTITKRSGINRTNVYDSLERLTEKGLVSYVIQSNRKYFEATSTRRIIKYLEEKEKEIRNRKKIIKAILPELEIKRKLSKEPQEATIYKGKKGLKSVAEDVIVKRKEVLIFGAEGKFKDIFTHYFKQWHLKRKNTKIKLKIIYNKKIKRKLPLAQIKYNLNLEETPATTWVYGDKTAIIVWSEQPLITLIRSKEVAKSYKQFFSLIWKSSKTSS